MVKAAPKLGPEDERIMDRLAQAALGGLPSVPPTIFLRVPRSHPLAGKLTKLAHVLASKHESEDGLRILALARPDAEKEILDLLRDIIGADRMDELLDRLAKAKPGIRQPQGMEMFALAGKLMPVLFDAGVIDKLKVG